MFLLFGVRSKDHRLAVLSLVCTVCGVAAAQTLLRRTTKFTLFFVPLFPVRPAKHYLQCAHCGAVRSVDAREAARLGA